MRSPIAAVRGVSATKRYKSYFSEFESNSFSSIINRSIERSMVARNLGVISPSLLQRSITRAHGITNLFFFSFQLQKLLFLLHRLYRASRITICPKWKNRRARHVFIKTWRDHTLDTFHWNIESQFWDGLNFRISNGDVLAWSFLIGIHDISSDWSLILLLFWLEYLQSFPVNVCCQDLRKPWGPA